MTDASKEDILKILEQVNYPGFSRNIVSFGMVGEVELTDGSVEIQLRISSSDESKKQQTADEVKRVIKEQSSVDNVSVTLIDPTESAPAAQPPEPSGNRPQETVGQGGGNDPWADHHKITNVKHVIAVASGKGGVGKSTVAANIASALKTKGHKVGILDLDIYGPSLPTLFGVSEQPYLTQDERIAPLEKYGMKLMSFGNILGDDSPVIWRGPMVAKMVDQFLNGIDWQDLDFLILDLPPGTGDVQLTLVQKIAITGAVIVTTPQKLALEDVKKGANMFRKVDASVLGIVENMSYFKCPHCGEPTDIFSHGGGESESKRLEVPLLGKIPLESDVMETSDEGHPVVLSRPETSSAKAFMEMTEKLMEQLKEVVE